MCGARGLLATRKILERVSDGYVHRREMPRVARENCQLMPTGRCSNGDVGKAWRMTTPARQIGQYASNLSCRYVKRQHTIAIEVQQGSQPR